jgi:hypothetical protein
MAAPIDPPIPTAASKKLLDQWEATANVGATQLRGAAPPKIE